MSFAKSLARPNPSVFFRRDPWYYFRYDGTYLVLCLGAIIAMLATGYEGIEMSLGWWVVPVFVGATYAQMLGHASVHNCCHINFPRVLNRWVGEVAGVLILTRYASWEILHRRHHKHSDDPEMDPHPVTGNFMVFLKEAMLINLEKSLHAEYHLRHGDTPALRRRETVRSGLSYFTMAALGVTWFLLLGPVAFVLFYAVPALIGLVWIAHFNWRTHNGNDPAGNYGPINVNTGIYRVLNRLCFGIYFHANHHAMASLFNPRSYDKVMADKAARRAAKAA